MIRSRRLTRALLGLATLCALAAVARAEPATASRDDARLAAAVWSGPADCRAALATGARLARHRPGTLRLGAWNIEWFPDHTDIDWLACTIAWMNLDLLAVEEIRDTDTARDGMARLLDNLRRLTGDDWRADLQRCGGHATQHVGFLYDAGRLALVAGADSWPLNARAVGPEKACAGHLRPGRADRFRPRDGRIAPFLAIAVHLKSGTRPRDQDERATALGHLAGATALDGAETRVVVLGDFNSMGDGTRDSAVAEIDAIARIGRATPPGLALARPTPACTEYYRGRGGALDHGLVSHAMGPIDGRATQVSGYCALARCAPLAPWHPEARPAAYRLLSDHCPLVIAITAAPPGAAPPAD